MPYDRWLLLVVITVAGFYPSLLSFSGLDRHRSSDPGSMKSQGENPGWWWIVKLGWIS